MQGKEPIRGVLQMVGQKIMVSWPEELQTASGSLDAIYCQNLNYGPSFAHSNDSSNIYACLESREPLLQWAKIVDMTKYVQLLVLTFAADLDGANVLTLHISPKRMPI